MKLVSIHTLILTILILFDLSYSNAQTWTLQQCIDTALINNKNILINKNNIELSLEKQKEAKANLIPKITANADYKYFTNLPYQLMPLSVFGGPEGMFKEAQFGVPHNINANLQFFMPLYNPTIIGAVQATKIATELTNLKYQKTEEQVIFEISNLYYNGKILQNQLLFIDSNLVNAQKLLLNIQLLNEQLLAKSTDVNKIKLQVLQLNTQRENILSKQEQVISALKFLMGIAANSNIQINTTIEYKSADEIQNSKNLDIQLTQSQHALLLTELNTLKFSRLPSLALYGTYGTTGYGYTEKPKDFLNFYPIGFGGVQLSYPIFNGTVTQRKINQKKIEIKNSDLQNSLITDQNAMQINNAKLQQKVAQKTIETTAEQIQQAQTIYNQIIIQQKQGTANLTDVLLADNALREAQQNYLSAIIDYLKSDLELKKLTGTILTKKQ